MTKSVKDIMTTKLETVEVSETGKDAAKKMVDKNVSSLVVINHDKQTITDEILQGFAFMTALAKSSR